ncbi:MAG: N-6 DNA methylase [Acidobacteria bacterium]|nr:N-6 DNA methylase [Acidobacteriota bacterium]
MAAYSGWGSTQTLKMAFLQGGYLWSSLSPEMEALNLSETEKSALLASQLNAHYTSTEVIDAIYAALVDAGIANWSTLRLLEPSAGAGNFIGRLPDALRPQAQITGVELDILTGQLLQAIYPETHIIIDGYEKAKLPKGFFDLIISNVPFGDYPVVDTTIKKKLRSSIHDYFFAKSIEYLKPGGVMAFITSRYTLDKADQRVREYLAQHTELLAAVRLPSDAFLQTAHTQVITDIIILRKKPSTNTEWTLTSLVDIQDTATRINSHFAANPAYILGKPQLSRGMYANNEMVIKSTHPSLGAAIQGQLGKQLQSFAPLAEPAPIQEATPQPTTTADHTLDHTLDALILSDGSRHIAVAIFDLYTKAKNYIKAQQLLEESDSVIDNLRLKLNQAYDTFRRSFGPINKLSLKGVNKTSPILLFVRGLEKKKGIEWVKTDIFFENTIIPFTKPQITTSADALQWSFAQKARVDIDLICELRGVDRATALSELTGLIFETPDGQLVSRSEYLSGNVRVKHKEAVAAAAIDTKYNINVEALTEALPPLLPPGKIIARLGAVWIDPAFINGFIAEIIPSAKSAKATHNKATNEWTITGVAFDARTSIEAKTVWGTSRKDAIELIACGLNSKTPIVYDLVDKEYVINDKESLLAQAKLTDIQTRFRAWLWEDENRAAIAAANYNETINCFVDRQYDGKHLQFPGSNKNIQLRTSQRSGIARILSEPSTLIGHLVGAGKTFIAVASAMEGKRIGLISKSLLIVPNHLTEQAGAMARTLYPGINLLVPDKEDTKEANRGALLTRIATNNFDLVILSHTAFQALPLKPEIREAYIYEDLKELTEALAEVENSKDPDDRLTAKQIQKKIKRYEAMLEKTKAIKHDSVHTITFEDLGINALFVDEADLFKNLEFHTNMTRIAGIPNAGSMRATDLKYKTRWLLENKHKVVFMTGTPISNTLCEAWITQMYLQPDLMKQLGFHHFDNWAASFAEATTSLEMKPDGSGYRMNTRFNKFINVPEMMAIWGNVLDLKTVEELELPASTIPFAGPQIIETDASPELKEYVKQLGRRADLIRSGAVDPKDDNMLVITSDGRKSALHMALVDPAFQGESPKVTKLCETVKRLYDEFQTDLGTQIIFIDIATPKGRKKEETVDTEDGENQTTQELLLQDGIYGVIKNDLVKKHRIPAEKIAFIHDAKTNPAKLALFNSMNTGAVRILLASTEKAGAGTNVQERLVGIHHLTTPWRPRDLDQRNGRMITAFSGDLVYPRPGNALAEKGCPLNLYYHITKGSVDGFIWQLIESKQKFISAVLRGKFTGREVEDVDQAVLNASQIKAVASGNPLIMEYVELEAEMGRLIRLYDSWITTRNLFEYHKRILPGSIARHQAELEESQETAEIIASNRTEDFMITLRDGETERIHSERAEAGKFIIETAYRIWQQARTNDIQRVLIGDYRGMEIWLQVTRRNTFFSTTDVTPYFKFPGNKDTKTIFALSDGYSGTIQSLDYHINNVPTVIRKTEHAIAHEKQQLEKAISESQKPFAHANRYQEVQKRLNALNHLLMQQGDSNLEELAQNYQTFIPELILEAQTGEGHEIAVSITQTVQTAAAASITVAVGANKQKLQPLRLKQRRRSYIPASISSSSQPSLFDF